MFINCNRLIRRTDCSATAIPMRFDFSTFLLPWLLDEFRS